MNRARKQVKEKEGVGIDRAKSTLEVVWLLRLKTSPLAYKRVQKLEELEKTPDVMRLDRKASFCQAPALARMGRMTVSLTSDNLGERCARICGLATTTKKEIAWETNAFGTGWFANLAQMMLLMNALQFRDYECFQFFFTGGCLWR